MTLPRISVVFGSEKVGPRCCREAYSKEDLHPVRETLAEIETLPRRGTCMAAFRSLEPFAGSSQKPAQLRPPAVELPRAAKPPPKEESPASLSSLGVAQEKYPTTVFAENKLIASLQLHDDRLRDNHEATMADAVYDGHHCV